MANRPDAAGPNTSRLSKALGAAMATPVVLVTAVRITRLLPGMPLDDLVERLRRAPPLRRSPRDPLSYVRAVARLLPMLPPYRTGRCLKRSLLLFALWSRLGFQPRLHFSILGLPGEVGGHAWLECQGVPPDVCGQGDGLEAAVVLPREPGPVSSPVRRPGP